MPNDAADLARRLAGDAEAVCRAFLSNGRREGRYWLVGDVLNAPGRSLYVRLRGAEHGPGAAGKWTDAATGEHGDLLDLIRLNRNLGTLGQAMDEARQFLALPRPEPPAPTRAPRSSPEAARRLYDRGLPIEGTPAEAYLRMRGITAELRSLPLRFHPTCYYRSLEPARCGAHPALLAAVTDLHGTITGVHRTWLDSAQSTKATLPAPRKAMGQLLGHGVRLGVAEDVLAAGEGLETMLSLRTVLPGMPAIASLSAHHLAALLVPARVRRLYVCCDQDAAGRGALRHLRDREDLRGIELLELASNGDDLNTDLRHRGAVALLDTVTGQLARADAVRFGRAGA